MPLPPDSAHLFPFFLKQLRAISHTPNCEAMYIALPSHNDEDIQRVGLATFFIKGGSPIEHPIIIPMISDDALWNNCNSFADTLMLMGLIGEVVPFFVLTHLPHNVHIGISLKKKNAIAEVDALSKRLLAR